MKEHVVIVDDEPRLAEILAMILRRRCYEVTVFSDSAKFIRSLEDLSFDLVLTDLKMANADGLQVLKSVKQKAPHTPVVFMTAHATIPTALEAIRGGAFDYLEKPFENEHCVATIERALSFSRIARENAYLREELRSRYHLDNLIVASEGMIQVLDLARRAARSDATALISGASGTGKELVARLIHFHGARIGKPFVSVNCKALASGVLESELFGHEKGAYTGAFQRKEGLFERAHGGTLFLDEIGEIDAGFQGKLLRVLQEREVVRVGGDRTISVDVRIVCATNRDLKKEVEQGRFREDLYFRLAVIPIAIPPLKERREDILPLAHHFLEKYSHALGIALPELPTSLAQRLQAHSWPGNVRELENAVERALVLSVNGLLNSSDFVPDESPTEDRKTETQENLGTLAQALEQATIRAIQAALEKSGGSKQDAARHLGIDRTTLYRLMKKHEVSDSGSSDLEES